MRIWWRGAALILLMLMAAVLPPSRAAEPPSPVIELPLEIHLVRDVAITRSGVAMTNWISATEIETDVMPEINRIWRQAGIVWKLAGISEKLVGDTPDRRELETAILDFQRQPTEFPQSLMRAGRTVAHRLGARPDRFHLIVVPYVGKTLQGFAMSRARVGFLGAWTDKPMRGNVLPRRVKLREAEPLFVGSIGRTASHELGHLLGLNHDTCSRDCLMTGTRSDGYSLTDKQIETARDRARHYLAQKQPE